MSALSAANKAKIGANRQAYDIFDSIFVWIYSVSLLLLCVPHRIFELDGCVNHNKARAYLARSLIAENAALINKNYNAAFLGNRQLANENTDALFRNRIALAQSLPATNEVETNYREATVNAAKLAFLDHRSRLNGEVLSVAQDLAALNSQAISINRRVMELNENIKEQNARWIG
jgi:hypothetical protein